MSVHENKKAADGRQIKLPLLLLFKLTVTPLLEAITLSHTKYRVK